MRKILTLILAGSLLTVWAQHPGIAKAPAPQRPGTAIGADAQTQHPATPSLIQKTPPRSDLHRAPRLGQSRAEDQLILAPEGEKRLYDFTSEGFYIYWGSITYGRTSTATNIVWGANGDVYFYNPLTNLGTESYSVGHVDGDRITVQMPQLIDLYDDGFYPDNPVPFYLSKMQLTQWERENPDTGETEMVFDYVPVADEDNYATYTIQADGTITLDWPRANINANNQLVELPEYILGSYYDMPIEDEDTGEILGTERYWYGVADWQQTYTLVDPDQLEVKIPDTVDMDPNWVLSSDSGTRFVKVGFEGEDVYLQGICDLFPDAAIKGQIDADGMARFPSDQFLGYTEYYGYFLYLIVADYDWRELLDEIEFVYDTDAKTFTPVEEYSWVISGNLQTIIYYAYYDDPHISYQTPGDDLANPVDPSLVYYLPDWGYGEEFGWLIPHVNVDGYQLDTSRMYYNIYVNYELYTFYTDEYMEFPEDMVDIPYDFTDGWDIYFPAPDLDLFLHCQGIDVIGCQSFYRGSDGLTYSSNPVHVNLEEFLGMNVAKPDMEVRRVDYYNLTGQRIDRPGPGLYLRVSTMADGSRLTEKVAIP